MSNENLYNLAAERQVLGAVIVSTGDALIRAMEILGPDDFYKEQHREVFAACIDLFNESVKPDLISLSSRLKGVGVYLSDVVTETPTDANIAKHARIVKEKSVLRRVDKWAKLITEKIQGDVKAKDLLISIERDIISLSETMQEKSSPDIESILIELHEHWGKQKSDHKTHIQVDRFFTESIPGLYPGHLWVIGGYTSSGKSTLLAQILRTALEDDARTVIFSTEDSRKDKAIKLLSNISDVSQKRLITGDFNEYQQLVNVGVDRIHKMPLVIYDDIYSVDEMRIKAKKHKMQGGLDVMAIDFIQNIQGEGSLYETMSKAIVDIQKLAKELDVTMLILSQVNNESMRGDSEVIGLKGAGELAAAADIVLWLKRSKKYGEERFLDCEIRKNRPFGKTGIVPLTYSEHWTRIEKRGVEEHANNSRYGD